jgi:type III pantothenate kinase
MHNLILDIGNTNSKVAVFKKDELLHFQSLKSLDQAILKSLIDKFEVTNSIVSTVKGELVDITDFLKQHTTYFEFSTQSNTGVKNHYKTLSTLGLDRWAKVIAAQRIYHGKNCYMIDAGTCITYDLLNQESEYYGGSISLGVNMRFRALNHFTNKLPLVDWNKDQNEIPLGNDTATAIENGVLQGIINEITGFIALQNKNNKDLMVVLTGGDAAFLFKQLKNSIFAPQIIHDPYLVLKGLNEVIAFEYVQKN